MRIVVCEAGVDYARRDAPAIRTPADVAQAAAAWADSNTECCAVLVLNAKSRLIRHDIVTAGLADASLVHPREIFRAAIVAVGSAVVLTHNHPSGDPTPSAEDVRITRQMVEAGRVVDIRVLDHVVIGRGGQHHSMRESGGVSFLGDG